MTKYELLLQNPLWKQRRDDFLSKNPACELCGQNASQVHHLRYIKGRNPWEYLDRDLQALCDPCHRSEHGLSASPPITHSHRHPFDDDGDWVFFDPNTKTLIAFHREKRRKHW